MDRTVVFRIGSKIRRSKKRRIRKRDLPPRISPEEEILEDFRVPEVMEAAEVWRRRMFVEADAGLHPADML